LKINFYGTIREDCGLGGIGVIVRDEHGHCVASLVKQLPHASSPLQVNLEACRVGLHTAIHHGWTEIILETSCKQLVGALENPGDDWSNLGLIVNDCKDYLKSFISFQIRHVPCKANGVALRLAHFASFSALDECWLDKTPSIIEDVLFEDFCNRTRGQGITPPSMYNHFHP
jgi:ribonuclease HI